MVEIIACKCAQGEGLNHTHIGKRFVYRRPDGREVRLDEHTQRLNIDLVQTWHLLREEPATIHIWIDWKAVAKALMQEIYERGNCPSCGAILSEVWASGHVITEFCDSCDYIRRITPS